MYTSYFGLKEVPFSLTPDPRYVYMSERHREALAHLLYGIGEGGGFVVLTGEVGTGKTTVSRALLEQLSPLVDVALILNPRMSARELVAAICDDLSVSYPAATDSLKVLVDALNEHLLASHGAGRRTVVLIDEAQDLSAEVLEQVRLLTNLETARDKLLQVILIGQPELNAILARHELRQLSQRIKARYHLKPLAAKETAAYVAHRLAVAGLGRELFTAGALRAVHHHTGGIPRLINTVCDRALLGAYAHDLSRINKRTVKRAAAEALRAPPPRQPLRWAVAALTITALGVSGWYTAAYWLPRDIIPLPTPAAEQPASTTEAVVTPVAPAPPDTPESNAARGLEALISFAEQPQSTIDEASAGTALFALWGRDYGAVAGSTLCQRATAAALRCLQDRGTWDSIRSLNLPALITLRLPRGPQAAAVVTGLTEQDVTLEVGGRRFVLPLDEARPLWSGDYIALWKAPPVARRTLVAGMRGDDVIWLRAVLEQMQGGVSSSPDETLFDNELKARVTAFQRDHGLKPDGVVGPQTLLHLSAATRDPEVPVLKEPPPPEPG